jgi:hypothetical protein
LTIFKISGLHWISCALNKWKRVVCTWIVGMANQKWRYFPGRCDLNVFYLYPLIFSIFSIVGLNDSLKLNAHFLHHFFCVAIMNALFQLSSVVASSFFYFSIYFFSCSLVAGMTGVQTPAPCIYNAMSYQLR